MNIERIKKITMLKTLKGTDDKGKPIYWLAGDVLRPDEKPLPQPILRELSTKRRGGPILEVEYKPEPESPPPPAKTVEPEKEKEPEETPDTTPDGVEEEKPKEDPPAKKSAKKAPARRRTQKK